MAKHNTTNPVLLIPGVRTYTYDGDGRLQSISGPLGTRTFTYDGNGKLTAIAGTGQHPDKTFTYDGDQLTAVEVG